MRKLLDAIADAGERFRAKLRRLGALAGSLA